MRAFFLYKILFACYLLSGSFALAQTYNHEEIASQVEAYNKTGEFEQTVSLLETILANPKATHYDRYQAYYLKYLTYKRLFSYQDAETNLEFALLEGLQSEQKDRISAQIKFEKLFVAFDLLRFEQVALILSEIVAADLELVDSSTVAFYFIVQGTMEIKTNNLEQAEEYYDQAIALLEVKDPQHLPLIYRKKIDLYRLANKFDQALESFDQGLFYAKKHNVDVYILFMHYDLCSFYTKIGDFTKAAAIQDICNKLAKEYEEGSAVGRLNILENKIANERIERQKKASLMHLAIVIGLVAFALLALGFIWHYLRQLKKTKALAVQHNNELRQRIVGLVDSAQKLSQTDTAEIVLSDRQKEVVELITQGKTNKEIAGLLFISENTVKYHLKNIYHLLNVKSRVDL